MSKLRHIPYAVLTAGSMLVGGGAYAQSMSTINQEQWGQQQQINHGVRDGQLTPGETARLEQGERDINRAQARAEGRLMKPEDIEALRMMVHARSGVVVDPAKTYVIESRLGPLASRTQLDRVFAGLRWRGACGPLRGVR